MSALALALTAPPAGAAAPPPSEITPGPTGGDQSGELRTASARCHQGPHVFGYFNGPAGKSFSATLDIGWFCHEKARVSNVQWSLDKHVYGLWTTVVRYDGVSVTRYCYRWPRKPGSCSGYAVKARFRFLYCYEPTHSWCPKRYEIYLRGYVHADGSWSWFRSYKG